MAILNIQHSNSELKLIKSQEDPLIQYFIIKKSLDMSPGKLGAQIAHAAELFAFYYDSERKSLLEKQPRGGAIWIRSELTKKWIDSSFTKVVLKAKDTEFEKIKEEFDCFVVKDAGLTEVEPGSETVIALFPMYKSTASKLIKRLQVL